jgi:hypothetical protein
MTDRRVEDARMRWLAYPEAKIVLEAALEQRPFLRGITPQEDLNKQAERMLFDTGRQWGFDLLMSFLRGTYNGRAGESRNHS